MHGKDPAAFGREIFLYSSRSMNPRRYMDLRHQLSMLMNPNQQTNNPTPSPKESIRFVTFAEISVLVESSLYLLKPPDMNP